MQLFYAPLTYLASNETQGEAYLSTIGSLLVKCSSWFALPPPYLSQVLLYPEHSARSMNKDTHREWYKLEHLSTEEHQDTYRVVCSSFG